MKWRGCSGRRQKVKKSMPDNNLNAFYKGKKTLITGGLGFIGSNLARALLEMQAEVTIVDNQLSDGGANQFNVEDVKNRIKIKIADIRDSVQMVEPVKEAQLIFNLAGALSHTGSMANPFLDLESNCLSQVSFLEICREHNPEAKIAYTATRSQYGRAMYLPVNESHPMQPADVNGINKLAGEWYHILYFNNYGLKAFSLRLTNTFGPGHQMKSPHQGVINWWIRQLIEGQKIKIYGDGSQVRDLNYVDDVVQALLLAMRREETCGKIYNLGGEALSLKDIAELMIKVYGKGEYELVPYPPETKRVEVGNYIGDYQKIQKTIGWKPDISVEEGFRATFDYYIKNKNYYW